MEVFKSSEVRFYVFSGLVGVTYIDDGLNHFKYPIDGRHRGDEGILPPVDPSHLWVVVLSG